MQAASDLRLLLCTFPDVATAERAAEALVGDGHAACASLLPGLRSVYRWQGGVERAEEVLLLVKSTAAAAPAAARALEQLHPYEVPELLTLRPAEVSAAYGSWLRAAVTEAAPDAS